MVRSSADRALHVDSTAEEALTSVAITHHDIKRSTLVLL
jgi:hypothetical protein